MFIKSSSRFIGALLLLACITFQCRPTTASQQTIALTTIPEQTAAPHLITVPADTLLPVYVGLKRKSAVSDFYRLREGNPVWSTEEQQNSSDSLIRFIRQSRYYGLMPSRYHFTELSELQPLISDEAKLRYELLVTDAYVQLHHELRWGVLKAQNRDGDSLSIASLDQAIMNGGIISSLASRQPAFPGYQELIVSLKKILDSAVVHSPDSTKRQDDIRTIAINLERWRHESKLWEMRHAVVNIPSYMIHVIDRGDTILASRVIVGKPDHPTPELTSIIECFTLYPYWHVPRKISVEEYLPVIQKDTTFLEKNDFDVLDRKGNVLDARQVPWASFHKNYFPVTLRQREGADNALGVIKFTFDNPFAVYLHDTNAKRLFRNNVRALSHGCIRMEKAEALAHYFMTKDPAIESRFVRKYLEAKTRVLINTPEPLPIYVRYFTAEVVAGKLNIYKDIYGDDKVLWSKMN